MATVALFLCRKFVRGCLQRVASTIHYWSPVPLLAHVIRRASVANLDDPRVIVGPLFNCELRVLVRSTHDVNVISERHRHSHR